MFTGLVESTGTIKSIREKSGIFELTVKAPAIAPQLAYGDSVSLSGACLTVSRIYPDSFSVEVIPETWNRTILNSCSAGSMLNIERAMPVSGRLDGHIVTGHVDGTAELVNIRDYGESFEYFFSTEKKLIAQIVPKGSVAVDGTSLTVIDVQDSIFSVGLIPSTLKLTTLGRLKTGDSVNIETDILAKYIFRAVSVLNAADDKNPDENNITWKKLADYGWTR